MHFQTVALLVIKGTVKVLFQNNILWDDVVNPVHTVEKTSNGSYRRRTIPKIS